MDEWLNDMGFPVGLRVKVVKGAFAQLAGTVGGHDPWRRKLRIKITIFGRTTPVEVGVDEVERDE